LNQLENRHANYLIKDMSDPGSQEFIFVYRKDGGDWRAYGQNLATTNARVEVLQRYGIGGIAWWRLGDEPNAILRVINPGI
jgi:spore germination protein YaaH